MSTGYPIQPPPNCLVPLARGSDKFAPLVLVHAVGGGALIYRDLLAALRAPHPVWGVYAPGLWDDTSPIVGLRAQASQYHAALVAAGVNRPALIGGSSYGGLVAFELERCYRAAGHARARVALIDSPAPGHLRPQDDAEVGALLVAALTSVGNRRRPALQDGMAAPDHDPEAVFLEVRQQLRAAKPEARPALVLRRAREILPEISQEDVGRQMAVIAQNLANMHQWQPEPSAASVHYFTATDRSPAFAPHTDHGWVSLAHGGLEVIPTPGNHWTMLDHPHVVTIARDLGRWLAWSTLA